MIDISSCNHFKYCPVIPGERQQIEEPAKIINGTFEYESGQRIGRR